MTPILFVTNKCSIFTILSKNVIVIAIKMHWRIKMNTNQAKQLAHDLAIKYIEVNSDILKDQTGSLDNINLVVGKFAEINNKFYQAIISNKILDNLY